MVGKKAGPSIRGRNIAISLLVRDKDFDMLRRPCGRGGRGDLARIQQLDTGLTLSWRYCSVIVADFKLGIKEGVLSSLTRQVFSSIFETTDTCLVCRHNDHGKWPRVYTSFVSKAWHQPSRSMNDWTWAMKGSYHELIVEELGHSVIISPLFYCMHGTTNESVS